MDREQASAKFWLSPVRLAYNLGFPARELRLIGVNSKKRSRNWSQDGMSTSEPKAGARIVGVEITEDELTVRLLDGRRVSAPLAWYPRLLHATPAQRSTWELSGAGFGIHWPEIDEDIAVAGLLAGAPAPGVRVSSVA